MGRRLMAHLKSSSRHELSAREADAGEMVRRRWSALSSSPDKGGGFGMINEGPIRKYQLSEASGSGKL